MVKDGFHYRIQNVKGKLNVFIYRRRPTGLSSYITCIGDAHSLLGKLKKLKDYEDEEKEKAKKNAKSVDFSISATQRKCTCKDGIPLVCLCCTKVISRSSGGEL